MWIDFLIFGSGCGLAAPACEEGFCWLIDETTGHGAFYHWDGWYGAQLSSFQWRRPRVGEHRRLMGRAFVAHSYRRRFGRVQVSWAMYGLPQNLDEANAELHKLHNDLARLI